MILRRVCVVGIGLAAMLGLSGARAEEPFYKNKRLNLLVNYAAGGPADVEARLFSKYIGRHIAGQPTVIVQNMDGAGGLTGTSYIGGAAPKDGMQVATDIVKARGLVAGGLGPENAKDLRIRLTLDLLGVPYKYVTGYRSSAPARIALQQGEINFYSESSPGYRSVVHPGIVKAGDAIPVYYDPVFDGGKLGRSRSMAGLPIATFLELYEEINHKAPTGPLWDAYSTVLTVIGAMQVVVALPPGSPYAAVETLRSAMAELDGDAEYAEDARRTIGFVPEWQTGPETNARVSAGLSVRPETKAFITDYIKTPAK